MLILLSLLLVGCKSKNNEEVKLLYSSSKSTINAKKEIIDNYDDYIHYNYPLDLKKSFFKNNILYTYSFLSPNRGSNLYLLSSYKLLDKALYINIEDNNNIISSPAISGYVLIFSIDKSYYQKIDKIIVNVLSEVS